MNTIDSEYDRLAGELLMAPPPAGHFVIEDGNWTMEVLLRQEASPDPR